MSRWMQAAAAALLATAAALAAQPAPGNDDVVRRFVQALSPDEVVEWLDTLSACRLDLSRPRVEELRDAGIPDAVLEAMRRCQRRSAPTTSPPAPQPLPLSGRLVVRFEPPAKPAKAPWKDSYTVVAGGLRPSQEERGAAPESVAFFVTCLTPEHAPDHWRDTTELRDHRRHRLLLFHAETEEVEFRRLRLLRLIHEPRITTAVAVGEHHLELGVAVRVADRWEVVARGERRGVLVAPQVPRELAVRLRTRSNRDTGGTPRATFELLPDS